MLVKAYILADLKTRNVSDVYKFLLNDEIINDPRPLAYLKESIKKEIPELDQKDFKIYWRDEDDDLVNIHSDSSLLLQIKLLADKTTAEILLKLYLEPLSPQSASVHAHIECDGCQKVPIVGPRFKCLQCPDYDLCTDCERNGVHMDHSMVRFSTPIIPGLHKPFSRFLKRRFIAQCSRNANNSDETSGEDDPSGCPFLNDDKKRRRCKGEEKRHHHHGRHEEHRKHGHGEHSRHGRDRHCQVNWGDLMNQYTGVASAVATAAARTASAAAHAATSDPSHLEMLRSIGQTVAKILDPLGIDVDIEMRQKDNVATSTQKTTEPTEQSNQQPKANPSQTEETVPASAPPQTDVAAAAIAAIPINAANLAARVQQITEALAHQHVDSSEPGWTVIGNETRGSSASPAAPPQPEVQAQTLYPDLAPTVTPRTHHPDPKIEEGIKQLLAMGFSNETGLLTEILQIHNGDVMKALDILAVIRR